MMSTPKKKDRPKLIKCFFVLKPSEKDLRNISIATKYCTSNETRNSDEIPVTDVPKSIQEIQESPADDDVLDENSLSLFCLPDGCEMRSFHSKPTFHSFLLTKKDGSRVYGSTLMIWDKMKSPEHNGKYINKAICFLTTIPLVMATRKLLLYIWENNCSLAMIQSICNLRMPSRSKCLKLCLPHNAYNKHENQLNAGNKWEEIYFYRGLTSFPLYDYPLRQLFTEVLSPDQFLIAFVATLLEYHILIVSESYYSLMMVAEALTALLLPFSWLHVYVPILPSKLDLNGFLEAPTIYIMGINSRTNDVPSLFSKFTGSMANNVGCRIDCDSNKVEYFTHENNNQDNVLKVFPPFVEELKNEIESILNPDSERKQAQSEALRRISEMARRNRFSEADCSYLDDLKLNQSIRLAFMKCIRKYVLRDHEKFIAYDPAGPKFDSVSFLCDQPESIRTFLDKFLQTQMFTSFIDESAKKFRKNKQLMLSSQSALNNNIINDEIDMDETMKLGDQTLDAKFKDAQVIQFTDAVTDSTSGSISGDLNGQLLASPVRQRRPRPSLDESKALKNRKLKAIEGCYNKNLSQNGSEANLTSPIRVPVALAAQTNWKVVESLLREVKIRTKRILLAKMGNDEIAPLGVGSPEDTEENTLVATLCDLIERIWGHARTNDKETVRCAFWTHVIAFSAIQGEDDENQKIDSGLLSPALSRISVESSSSSSQSSPPSPVKQRHNNDFLKPLSNTFNYAFKSVQSMIDVKTDIGKSRAFIRLALERKLLSKHLRVLLSNQELVNSMYKRYAFLRGEEEREQFLTHLLTLNAVDLHCFTNTFTTTTLSYTLVFDGSGPLSGWISLSGTIRHTEEIPISSVNKAFTFRFCNLGFITSLTIFVDPKICSKLYIGLCFIRNEITGHIYKFPFNRWFGKNIEDGALERVMIGEFVNNSSIGDIIKKNQRSTSIGRHWTRSSSSTRDDDLDVQELQQKLGESVNEIVRFYYNNSNQNHHHSDLFLSPIRRIPNRNSSRQTMSNLTSSTLSSKHSNLHSSFNSNSSLHQKSLVSLIFGEKQFLWTLHQIFFYGFKHRTRSSFRKQIFLWDFLDQVCCELKFDKNGLGEEATARMLINLTESIACKACNWGKDAKFDLFLIVSLRDHILNKFVKCLSKSSRTKEFYETNSFLRDPLLMTFLLQILTTFDEMNLNLDSSLTKFL